MNTINQQIQEIIRQQKSLQLALDRCVKELAEKEPSVSETKQQDLSKVISQAELNGLEIKDHYMADLVNSRKNYYAFLLIALLKEISVVLSEDQYVLLRLLLQSMKLEHELGYYFEDNTKIDDQFLLDFKSMGQEISQSLLADLMIIARMNGAFDQQALQTLSELMSFFEIEESNVKEMDNWVAYVLGLENKLYLTVVDMNISLNEIFEANDSQLLKLKIVDMVVGMVGRGKVLISLESEATRSSWTNTTKKAERRLVNAPVAGYFCPDVTLNTIIDKPNNLFPLTNFMLGNTWGKIIVMPQYLNFWYSFIDLEKVIKENK